MFTCGDQYVEVYDTLTSNFIAHYKSTDSTVIFNDMFITGGSAYFIGEWLPMALAGLIVKSSLSTLEDSPFLDSLSSSVFSVSSTYSVMISAVSPIVSTSYAFNDGADTLTSVLMYYDEIYAYSQMISKWMLSLIWN